MRFALSAVLLCALFPAHAAERWKIQFFYDKPDAVLEIRDLACVSSRRCVAAGAIGDMKGRVKGATVVTSDGGEHWTLEDFADEPVSLFFLPESPSTPSVGWMVAQHGIWKTEESGRSWKKVAQLKGIAQVNFLDAMHGFAIGYPKAIYETTDGGTTWEKVAAAQTPLGRPEDVIYEAIAFSGQQGIILGQVMNGRQRQYPIWLTPNAERSRKQKQSTMLTLQTLDGGKNWKASSSQVVGDITELRFTSDGHVFSLVEYHDLYSLPSAVIRVNLRTPGSQTIFAEKDRAVRDLALLDDGSTLLAAVEPPGTTNQVPVPGKLKMLRSKDLKTWEEMDVDYRADAQRATIAAADARHAWVATDTGMILALEPEEQDRPKHLP